MPSPSEEAMATKISSRERRKQRIRNKISGTSQRPRLSVYRSSQHIYAQVIDDSQGTTLAAASSHHKKQGEMDGTKRSVAEAVGEQLAKLCLEKGIQQVVFDRNGFIYHGRVKALADGARKGGLQF
jgi:large subunit ribosomal protein L18